MPEFVQNDKIRGGLIVPDSVLTQAERRAEITSCPHAELIEKDGETQIFCQKAREVLSIKRNPVITGAWCCGGPINGHPAYAHPEQGCPVYLGEDRDIKAHEDRVAAAKTDRMTRRQIETGARVDDRGLDEEREEALWQQAMAPGSAIFANPHAYRDE